MAASLGLSFYIDGQVREVIMGSKAASAIKRPLPLLQSQSPASKSVFTSNPIVPILVAAAFVAASAAWIPLQGAVGYNWRLRPLREGETKDTVEQTTVYEFSADSWGPSLDVAFSPSDLVALDWKCRDFGNHMINQCDYETAQVPYFKVV